jgi:pimeloyl-ACP methyl ester carboxylesterase
LTCPVLVLRAGDDDLVRPERTAALVASFSTSPDEVVIAGGHNDLQLDPAYDEALRRFLG